MASKWSSYHGRHTLDTAPGTGCSVKRGSDGSVKLSAWMDVTFGAAEIDLTKHQVKELVAYLTGKEPPVEKKSKKKRTAKPTSPTRTGKNA